MQYARLGASDLRVSRLCLGTVFRSEPDDATCLAAIRNAAELGCNFIDCADFYGTGRSERIVGAAVKGQRERFVISTKVGAPMPEAPAGGLRRDYVLRACEASLRRLSTDYVDCYLCHFPDPATPLDETLSAFDRLVTDGKVRYPGVSNFSAAQVREAVRIGRRSGSASIACNQVGYSLLDRRIEHELLPAIEPLGVGVTAYATTAIGLLAGRYRYGRPPPAGSSWRRGPYNFRAAMTPATGRVIDAVLAAARRCGVTPSRVATAWCLRLPAVNAAIIGTDTPEQVRRNFADADWELPPEEAEKLDRCSAGARLVVRKDCPHGYRPEAAAGPA